MARLLRSLPLLLAVTSVLLSDGLAAPKKKPVRKTATPAPATPIPTAPGELPLYADGAIVIDALTGQTLYEKNADQAQFPASTTKIVTALLIIEAGDLERPVEITLEDSKVGESSLYIKPGQTFTRRQMLYGLMLKSANDVAHALGRDNAGTMEDFAKKMTLRAQELGATNTSFRNPHGLHHKEHYCSPRDLAIVTRAAMQQPLFRQIVSTRSYDWPGETGPMPLSNHNRLLARFPGCNGVKTGYTIPAQQVLASAALRGNREVVAIVMHTNRPGIWDDSMLLLSYGLERAADDTSKIAAGK
jgi:serine-type D-Ala-D-Ala carboxypeptidase (penicillin-binding protein 5/6)